MAGSRLEKIGTVFTRVRDLMRSGVMKPHEKPICQILCRKFSTLKTSSEQNFIKSMEQDLGRWICPGLTCVRQSKVVEQYEELKNSTDLDEDSLFEETGKRLLAQGLVLKRKGPTAVVPENKQSVLNLKLSDMLAEQQSLTPEEEETMKTSSTPQTTV
ncbi:hypothetical protein WMY93_015382 [Mugilogobius chulae]|uniref:Small ribosomal subunit protein mS23 conserved domain-containing protein n=1 Tax=Mugilogobius chulae TaxID=88201 RepID=A0AAW0NQD9_9GOBI